MFATLKSWLKPTPTAARPQPKLALTALEAREVPAFLASWSTSDMVLRLTGTNSDDTATVLQANGVVQVVGAGGIQVKVNGQVVGVAGALPSTQIVKVVADGYDGKDAVTMSTIPFLDYRDYSVHRPLALEAYGGKGNDTFKGDNFYVVKDTLDGGSGDDRLEGNAGDDTLTGGADQDQLVGGGGNDTLDGGSGNDWLFGDYGTSMHPDTYRAYNTTAAQRGGADTLRGGSGNDYLWGEGGNDAVYGQGGNDQMYGGWGNDGLFGGSHDDNLYGEYGADRLLVWVPTPIDLAYPTLHGVEAEDAVLTFKDSQSPTTAFGASYPAKGWTQTEIETLDEGLGWLHGVTNSTKMLELPGGSGITFTRVGKPAGGTTIHGWNSGGQQTLTDRAFDDGNLNARLTILHEMAHSWQNTTVNPIWSGWLSESGWAPYTGGAVPAGKMVSNGGGWVYNTSAVFPLDRDVNGNGVITAAENAGNSDRANPGEDWAWSFETYYRFRIGELDAATASRMAGKFALIEAFLASMG